MAPPTGYLSTEALTAAPRRHHDAAHRPDAAGRAPPTSRWTSTAGGCSSPRPTVAEGGPGPDDPLGTVAVRQRILAEAAVRLVDEPRTPLVVVLPQTWTPDRPRAFWRGLGVPWLSLTDPTTLVPDEQIAAEELDYPPEQRAAELPAANFTTAQQLVEAGQVLANVLTNNDEIDQQVTDEVLASLSYGSRRNAERGPAAGRAVAAVAGAADPARCGSTRPRA